MKWLFFSLMVCLFLVGSFTSLYAQDQSSNSPVTVDDPTPAPIPEIPHLPPPVTDSTSVAPMIAEPSEGKSATVPGPASSTHKFVVFIPEKMDLMWFWYYYTDVQQHFVQSAVEKALMSAGKDIVDLTISDAFQGGESIMEITHPAEAVKKAMALGATYAIIGQAQAIKSSENIAYGVRVFRANAEASARIIRVKDGKLITMEEASAQGSGQSSQAAAQAALKDVGKIIASKLVAASSSLGSAE